MWISYEAVVLAGVTIGDGAIIGTRAVVTKDVPPYTIIGGVPAKEIRKRFSEDDIDNLLKIKWWTGRRKKRIQYDIETYILPRLADVQTMNEWKELKRELYKEQSTKRVKLITFFYNAVSSACSTSNLANSRMLFKESGLSKDDVLENMDLLQEVLKYEDDYGNDVKGYISMVLENMN